MKAIITSHVNPYDLNALALERLKKLPSRPMKLGTESDKSPYSLGFYSPKKPLTKR